MEGKIKYSVIIPIENKERYFEGLLRSLTWQSIKPAQILVIDSSSSFGNKEIYRNSNVDLIKINPHMFDHGGSRNLAASKAQGNILVFLTQDILIKDDKCIEKLIHPLLDPNIPNIAASYGRQIPKEDAHPVEIFARSFNYPKQGIIKEIKDLACLGIKTLFFSNVCSAIKRNIFEEVGGFPEKTIMNEDMYLAAKLLINGYKIAYQSDAIVYHSHNFSFRKQFGRYFDIGVFFNENRWIKNMANSEREGFKYFMEEIRFLIQNGWKIWIPYALLDTAIRFMGYQIGLREKGLPLFLKRKISLNKGYWKNI